MKIYAPNYYKKFKCIADKCPDWLLPDPENAENQISDYHSDRCGRSGWNSSGRKRHSCPAAVSGQDNRHCRNGEGQYPESCLYPP